jgi:hypothetical protein
MKKVLSAALAVAIWLTAQPLLAHGFTQPKHGGVVSMSGETLFELVMKPKGLELYVIDDDDPVVASGMTARLTVNVGGKLQNVMLKPAAGNRFDGPALKAPAGTRIAVLVIDTKSQAHLGTTFTIK